ncbi:transcription initiation protein SPT3 [Nematocida sp. AWRm80]|nr:transcription initiation protein SPT3 [Nematocida sp. AWRm80]
MNMEGSVKLEIGKLKKESEKDKELGMYQAEIKSMMYACGDVRTPEKDSSMYIEQIVYVQMKMLLEQAHRISMHRKSKRIKKEDIVFILRKNPNRVKKLSNYIVFKDIRNKVNKDISSLNNTADAKLKYSWLTKNTYKKASELNERHSAINKITESMTKEEYLDFTECRQASFTFRKSKRFKEFLNTEYKMKDDVIDILGFVAYEIVFDIVSLAAEISSVKGTLAKVTLPTQRIFRNRPYKTPISIYDIDEACRRLKIQKTIF